MVDIPEAADVGEEQEIIEIPVPIKEPEKQPEPVPG